MLRSPIRRALFISLCLSTLMILLTYHPKQTSPHANGIDGSYPFRMNLRADLSQVIRSNAMVQDTLNYYVAEFAGQSGQFNTSWQSEFCCGDAADLTVAENRAFRSTLTADFPQAQWRLAALQRLQKSDYLRIREVHALSGMSYGTVDLFLPIPGTAGEVLTLKGVAFNFRLSGEPSAYSS